MAKSTEKNALTFIFITVLIDVIGIGLIIPVVPDLLKDLGYTAIDEEARIGGYLTFAYAIFNFLCAPLLGNLSDRYGRRPVLLISMAGLAVDYVIHAMTPTLWLLMVGRVLAGICGATFSTANAYIADVSTPEKRAQNFGLVGAAFGLGFIIGPALGGLLGSMGSRAPFWAAAALALLNLLYGYFVLPESLPANKRRAFVLADANPLSALKSLSRYADVKFLLLGLTFLFLAGYSVQATWTFYTKERMAWDAKTIGISLAVVGLVSAVVQGGLLGMLTKRFKPKNLLLVGLGLEAVGLAFFANAGDTWIMMLGILPYCGGNISGPVIQGAISGQVAVNEQGALQGTITSIMSLCTIVGPPLHSELFAYFSSAAAPIYLPGAPFWLGIVFTAVAAIVVLSRPMASNVNPEAVAGH